MNSSYPVVCESSLDSIRVFLRDFRTKLRVGIYKSEMTAAQPVVINIEIEASQPHFYNDANEKKLDRVIDYERLYNFVSQDLPKLGHVCLLETIGDHIVTFCFEDERVRHVRVRLEKTEIFSGVAGAGIELVRTRKVKAT